MYGGLQANLHKDDPNSQSGVSVLSRPSMPTLDHVSCYIKMYWCHTDSNKSSLYQVTMTSYVAVDRDPGRASFWIGGPFTTCER